MRWVQHMGRLLLQQPWQHHSCWWLWLFLSHTQPNLQGHEKVSADTHTAAA